MRVLILGGDGYLGWPTAMHLSAQGHKVAVADNYLRRRLCREEKVDFLYAVPDLNERAVLWQSVSGHETAVHIGDLSEWDFIAQVFEKFEPEVIVHYAEQPAAPYSMLNRKAATLTLHNNLSVTANVIFAVREFCPDAHIVKLGTMGEYGTPNIDIEEGWLEVEHNGRQHMFLYPRQDERLLPFFNYDEIFGTVLNRFVVQAVAGYPLTVYGKGGQTRGYLNIKDTLNCVRLAVENPAKTGELRIFNQFTETFSINDLAAKVKKAGKQLALKVEIEHIENPRIEAETHYYNPKHTGLLDLGLTPHYLSEKDLLEMMEFVRQYKARINKDQIYRNVKWN
jgi:UDP-sulfoquinovose synthase